MAGTEVLLENFDQMAPEDQLKSFSKGMFNRASASVNGAVRGGMNPNRRNNRNGLMRDQASLDAAGMYPDGRRGRRRQGGRDRNGPLGMMNRNNENNRTDNEEKINDKTAEKLAFFLSSETYKVRVSNVLSDIIEPLGELFKSNNEKEQDFRTSLHTEMLRSNRRIAEAIERQGQKTRFGIIGGFVDFYQFFKRSPFLASLTALYKTTIMPLTKGLRFLAFGRKGKSDTEKVEEAVRQQTEFFRTGKVLDRGFFKKLIDDGIAGTFFKSIGSSIASIFSSPKEEERSQYDILVEILEANQVNNDLLRSSDARLINFDACCPPLNDLLSESFTKVIEQDKTRNDLLRDSNRLFSTDITGRLIETRDLQENKFDKLIRLSRGQLGEQEELNKRQALRNFLSIVGTGITSISNVIGGLIAAIGGLSIAIGSLSLRGLSGGMRRLLSGRGGGSGGRGRGSGGGRGFMGTVKNLGRTGLNAGKNLLKVSPAAIAGGVAGFGLDKLGGLAESEGYEGAGAGLKTAGSTASGAATGAALGGLIGGPFGALLGAGAGGAYGLGKGIYENYFSDDSKPKDNKSNGGQSRRNRRQSEITSSKSDSNKGALSKLSEKGIGLFNELKEAGVSAFEFLTGKNKETREPKSLQLRQLLSPYDLRGDRSFLNPVSGVDLNGSYLTDNNSTFSKSTSPKSRKSPEFGNATFANQKTRPTNNSEFERMRNRQPSEEDQKISNLFERQANQIAERLDTVIAKYNNNEEPKPIKLDEDTIKELGIGMNQSTKEAMEKLATFIGESMPQGQKVSMGDIDD